MAIEFVAGALSWTALEYVIHRWMGHDRRLRRTPFGIEHTRHHAEGNYFAPSWKKVAAALMTVLLVGAPAVAIGSRENAISFVCGLVGFYGCYELLHRFAHTRAPRGLYGRWQRRHHFHHHFVDPRSNHGVTSPLWDLVFGTYTPVTATIRVPRRLAMPWLLRAEQRGDIVHGYQLAPPLTCGETSPST